MNKKSVLLFASACTIAAIGMSFDILSDNGRAGRTGSPGETTCNTAQCHNDNPQNDGVGSVTISSPDMFNWEYMTGDTYTINVTVSRTGSPLFGLGVECLTNDAVPQNAGSLIITNSAETQIKTALINTVMRRNVVHQLNGGAANNTKTFSFKWAAPTTNVGNVTFYVAGNASNGDGFKTGDFIYTTTQQVTPAIGATVSDINAFTGGLKCFPNPATDILQISFVPVSGENVSLDVFDLNGKQILNLYQGIGNGISRNVQLDLSSNFSEGVYFLRLQNGDTVTTEKVVIQH